MILVKWTEDEWRKVAGRAAELHKQHPALSWLQLIGSAQDGLPIDRRRSNVASVKSLRPMFEILGLDESGCEPAPLPPPPPPPHPKKPENAPAPTTKPVAETAAPVDPELLEVLQQVPTALLVIEMMRRVNPLVDQLKGLTELVAKVQDRQAQFEAVMQDNLRSHVERQSARLLDVEIEVGQANNRVKAAEDLILQQMQQVESALTERTGKPEPVSTSKPSRSEEVPPSPPPKPPLMKVALVGPRPTDFEFIKNATAGLNIAYNCVDGRNSLARIPEGYDFVLVSGRFAHGCWPEAHRRYAERAIHVQGGNSAFIAQVERCYAELHPEVVARRNGH